MAIYDSNDTICAISTAPGVGGIAVARVSGRDALAVVGRIWLGKDLATVATHTAHLGDIRDSSGDVLDTAVATVFRGPRSFTGEDTVELSVHGSLYIQRRLIASLVDAGARLAEPGEFTRRAFASGRFDLAQAEAVADIIAADSQAAHRLASTQMRGAYSERLNALRDDMLQLASLLELELDFSEEEVEFASRERLLNLAREVSDTVGRLADSFGRGDAIRRGVSVAIVGQTNAGKSSLLNRLLRDDRAIVSDIHGTTRDIIEDSVDIGGVTFRFIDTAGLRQTDDSIENLGIERALRRMAGARIVIWAIDPTAAEPLAAWTEIEPRIGDGQTLVPVINKRDLAATDTLADEVIQLTSADPVVISATADADLDTLEERLVDITGARDISASDVIVTNARHYAALTAARESIGRVIDGLATGLSGDFIAQDLRETIHHLSTITGTITTTDILSSIFSQFCIGK